MYGPMSVDQPLEPTPKPYGGPSEPSSARARRRRNDEDLKKVKFPYLAGGIQYYHPDDLQSLRDLDDHMFDLEDTLADAEEPYKLFVGVGAGAAFGVLASTLVTALGPVLRVLGVAEESSGGAMPFNPWPAIITAVFLLAVMVVVTYKDAKTSRVLRTLRRAYRERRRNLALEYGPDSPPGQPRN